jgi:hypothetical protein
VTVAVAVAAVDTEAVVGVEVLATKLHSSEWGLVCCSCEPWSLASSLGEWVPDVKEDHPYWPALQHVCYSSLLVRSAP